MPKVPKAKGQRENFIMCIGVKHICTKKGREESIRRYD